MAGNSDDAVSTTLSEWLVVILIVFSLFFEFLLHRVEHWITRHHQHLQSVVRVLYRELMVLGVVSFGFIFYETIASPSHSVVLSFDFAHVFIFLLAIFHTIVILSTMFTSLRFSARWKEMEQVELVHYLHLKEQYHGYRLRIHRHRGAYWRSFQWWFPHFSTLTQYWRLHEMMTFHDIRFQFIFYRNLPEDFRFSSFLRKIKSATFIELVESHWSLYAIFLVIVLGDITRRTITHAGEKSPDVTESVFILASAVLLAVLLQLLAYKIRRIYWELTEHPRVYFEGVEPTAVAEELAAVENRLVEQRANRRISRSLDNSDDPANLADDENTDQAEIPRDSPETEMLNSMNHTPLSIPLVMAGNPNNLALASRNVRSASMENRIPARHSSLRSVSDDPRFSLPADKYVQQYRPAHTTSLDLSRPSENIYAQLTSDVAEHHADAASLQVFYTGHKQPDPLQALRVSEEIDEIAARHSLEISRNGHNNPPHRVAGKMRDYSVAKAAVAAARKRSIEVQFDRQSIEKGQGQTDKISLHSSNVLNKLSPSRGVSTDDDVLKSGSEYVHHGRRSIELTAAMPREELVNRHNLSTSLDDPERDLEAGIVYDHKNEPNTSGNANKSPTQKTSNLRFAKIENDKEQMGREEDTNMNPIQNSKSLRIWNNTILKNLEHQEEAKNAEPAKYPWIVTQLVPRLGRVASPVEKLFWFGSHRFFLWCVQFILFFSTVLLAAATSSLALLLLAKEEKGVTGLNIASSILPPITLLFTLFRTADIIKKYIFILHNASLVPEAMALEAIRNVSKKKPFLTADDLSSESGSETEREEESAKERRRRLGKFFRSEAAQGNVTGIEATSDRPPSAVSAEVPARRVRKRKLALRLRRKKARTPETDFPQIPAFVASANQAPLE